MMYKIVFWIALLAVASAVDWDEWTPLDDYMNRADPYYNYELLDITQGDGFSVHLLNMTSLKWFDESWVHNPVWWHHLFVFIPDDVRIFDAALYRISNGGYNYPMPDLDDEWIQLYGGFSARTGAVSAMMKQAPNQPTTFTEDPLEKERIEDWVIAHTWRMYIESEEEVPDREMILQFPMVKAAKHGMDTVVQYAKSINPDIIINKYMPTGASKRGWVSWLLGCADRRVIGIIPLVFDLLDLNEGFHYHYQAMGGWSWALLPYWQEPVTKYLEHPRTDEIMTDIDPLQYNERLTMPKLIVIASADEFFIPSNTYLWWEQLNGYPNNHMLILENEDHFHDNSHSRVLAATEPFFLATLNKQPVPQVTWERHETNTTGSIIVTVDTPTTSVQGFIGDTTDLTGVRRDFRKVIVNDDDSGLMNNPMEFVETPVTDLGDGQYSLEFPVREVGYRGFYVNVCFAAPDEREFCFSSELQVVPDTLPFPRCRNELTCQGILV